MAGPGLCLLWQGLTNLRALVNDADADLPVPLLAQLRMHGMGERGVKTLATRSIMGVADGE